MSENNNGMKREQDSQNEWLTRIELKVDRVITAQSEIKADVAALKVKAGIWGALGGMIPTAIVIILWILKMGN